ncbi:heavy metal translocating P-type ATPase [Halostagnicola bangensis]
MSDRRTKRNRCLLCGTALESPPTDPPDELSTDPPDDLSTESLGTPSTEADSDDAFCSSGCSDVYDVLGAPTGSPHNASANPNLAVDEDLAASQNDGETASQGDDDQPDSQGEDSVAPNDRQATEIVRTFFRVDGMHSVTCEAFLESTAGARDGVERVAASYVTETVRVDHDPERISETELQNALSRVGYTAYLRSDTTGKGDKRQRSSEEGETATGTTQRSREMTGLRKRRTDDMLEIRYIVGVVFGTFLLVPYVAILYPVYLASITDWGMLSLYEGAFENLEGLLFLPLFFVLTAAILYLTGMPLLRGSYISLRLRRPNTHLLAALTITCAYIYGTLSFLLGGNDVYYDLTVIVAAVIMAAVFYEATIKRRAIDRLTDLTISQVEEARLLESSGTSEVPVEELESSDRVLVRRGERIPVDGVLLESACTVDEAIVTGESVPVSKAPGERVIGGSVVTNDAAVVRVGEQTTSSIDRLTRVVWNVQSADHGVQRRGDQLAGLFVPVVCGAAAVVGATLFVLEASPATIAMSVLLTVIVSSPWAIGFATPVSVASSIRDAMDRGIVVFDETVFERLRAVDIVVFDKTGTLTTGKMTVLEADAPEDVLEAAGLVERRASHPAAAAIEAEFADGPTDPGDPSKRPDGGFTDERPNKNERRVRDFRSHDTGVEGTVDGRAVLVGHPALFRERGWDLDDRLCARVSSAREFGRLPVVVGTDGRADGVVIVGDEPRNEWDETVTELNDNGVEVVVLTGDDETATDFFDRHPGVDRVFTGVPPAGKTATIRCLNGENRVAMVGDGTNDAPALAEADLGIALGGGTALASDAADLAIVDDDLTAVERAFALSTAARRRVTQNLGLALVYNALVIPLAVVGVLNPLFATVAVATSSLLIVANSSRPLIDE